MKKVLRFVAFLALAILVIGGICIAAGYLTGAESSRIYSVVDNTYGLTALLDSLSSAWNQALADLTAAWNGVSAAR